MKFRNITQGSKLKNYLLSLRIKHLTVKSYFLNVLGLEGGGEGCHEGRCFNNLNLSVKYNNSDTFIKNYCFLQAVNNLGPTNDLSCSNSDCLIQPEG